MNTNADGAGKQQRIKIFFCYAHGDEILLNRLRDHLSPLQHNRQIDLWHDRNISAGSQWKQEINKELDTAHIILLLISANFMVSEYCFSIEMQRALERQQRGEARVISIILSPVYWQIEPLKHLQALPRDVKPITEWDNQDAAFLNIVEGIRGVVKSLEDERIRKAKEVEQGPTIETQSPNHLSKKKLLLIIVLVIVLVSGVGSTLYSLLPHFNPTITGTSNYHVGTIPAGATGTFFRLKGRDFISNAVISFLLDGKTISGSQNTRSDSHGNVSATIPVTETWTLGDHMITAKDTGGNTTKIGLPIKIVALGKANIPGPQGAPPDDFNGIISGTLDRNYGFQDSNSIILKVRGTGGGGTVCGQDDDGQNHTQIEKLSDGSNVTVISATTCSGNYQGGKLTYTQTVVRVQFIDDDDNVNCKANSSYIALKVSGTFVDGKIIKGVYSSGDISPFTCLHNKTFTSSYSPPGTWTGTATTAE